MFSMGVGAMPGSRSQNDELRGRKYLEKDEVMRIVRAAAKLGRQLRKLKPGEKRGRCTNGQRDSAMILIAYRHAFRVSELVNLRWEQINLERRSMFVKRLKGSSSQMHTMQKDEVAVLRALGGDRTGLVFRSELGGRMARNRFNQILARAAQAAGLKFPVNPHMLRHGCGFELTNRGIPMRYIQDWMGHANLQHTAGYAALCDQRFRAVAMWDD